MSGLVLWCSTLLISLPTTSATSTETDREAYQVAKAEAGRDPEAHVKLALWCEAHGMPEERAKHLVLATLIDPKQTTARGLMGLVSIHDHWVRPEKVAEEVKTDAAIALKLAEYNARRTRMDQAFVSTTKEVPGHRASPARVSANLRLGLWCEQVGLPAEATAHFTTVVLLNPRNKTAWQHLGYTRQPDGSWKTAQQLADIRAEAETQQQADTIWEPKIKAWRNALSSTKNRPDALKSLAEVHDPRAVPSVAMIFGNDGRPQSDIGVQVLGQINSPASSKELVAIALASSTETDVKAAAIAILRERSPRDYAKDLVDGIHTPFRYWVEPVGGPGSPGYLVVENPRYRMLRAYDAPPIVSLNFETYAGYDTNGLPIIETPREMRRVAVGQDLAQIEMRTATLIASANAKAFASQQRLRADILAIEQTNFDLATPNEQNIELLRKTLDAPETLGVDENAWQRWYYDKIGYSYTPPRRVTLAVNASPQSYAPVLADAHAACFVAGTLVRTLDGHRPIESLSVGEQVLAQNPRTGALAYRTVNFVHHNPPAQTLRITTESGETVVASIYHRFWRAGKGWVLARELVIGDVLRTLGGSARISEILTDRIVPVYNLDVAGDHTYFVGNGDALVHDNTLPEDHVTPFDAPTALALTSASLK